ncbi:hypothetical protein IB677_08470 [Francisella adeliensis]|nr:hypothetical protein [Francisella adeliensis]
MQEKYPSYEIVYDICFNYDTSNQFIKKITANKDDKIIYVDINATFIVGETNQIHDLQEIMEKIAQNSKQLSRDIWTLWFSIYNFSLHPSLTPTNRIYNDGSLYMLEIEKNNGSLKYIEYRIQKALSSFHVVCSLYNKTVNMNYKLGQRKSIQKIFLQKEINKNFVCGNVKVFMNEYLDSKKEYVIKTLKEELECISTSRLVEFKNIKVNLSFGPLRLPLGSKLDKNTFIDGGTLSEILYE